MSAAGDPLVNRLRADLELKVEIIKALRLERENDDDAAREQAELMTAVCTDLHARAMAMGLVLAERDPVAVQRAAEQFLALSADLCDLTAAKGGKLVLAREAVHLRQLLKRIAGRSLVEVQLSAEVPERIIADQTQLSKLLLQFVREGLESVEANVLALDVAADAIDERSAMPQVRFTLRHLGPKSGRRPAKTTADATPTVRLRAALARALCGPLRATLGPLSLALPLERAADQAHTGMFRLALSEGVAVEAAAASAAPGAMQTDDARTVETRISDDASIDLMYLDRQLGSLATVILARTAPAFVAQAPRRMTDLHVAHEIGDLKRLRRVAHAWKGSALSVGACRLAAFLDAIEKQAAADQSPGAGSISQVRSALDRVVSTLTSQIDRAGHRHERA